MLEWPLCSFPFLFGFSKAWENVRETLSFCIHIWSIRVMEPDEQAVVASLIILFSVRQLFSCLDRGNPPLYFARIPPSNPRLRSHLLNPLNIINAGGKHTFCDANTMFFPSGSWELFLNLKHILRMLHLYVENALSQFIAFAKHSSWPLKHLLTRAHPLSSLRPISLTGLASAWSIVQYLLVTAVDCSSAINKASLSRDGGTLRLWCVRCFSLNKKIQRCILMISRCRESKS